MNSKVKGYTIKENNEDKATLKLEVVVEDFGYHDIQEVAQLMLDVIMDAANYEGSYDALREKRGLPKGDLEPQINIDDVLEDEEDE